MRDVRDVRKVRIPTTQENVTKSGRNSERRGCRRREKGAGGGDVRMCGWDGERATKRRKKPDRRRHEKKQKKSLEPT